MKSDLELLREELGQVLYATERQLERTRLALLAVEGAISRAQAITKAKQALRRFTEPLTTPSAVDVQFAAEVLKMLEEVQP